MEEEKDNLSNSSFSSIAMLLDPPDSNSQTPELTTVQFLLEMATSKDCSLQEYSDALLQATLIDTDKVLLLQALKSLGDNYIRYFALTVDILGTLPEQLEEYIEPTDDSLFTQSLQLFLQEQRSFKINTTSSLASAHNTPIQFSELLLTPIAHRHQHLTPKWQSIYDELNQLITNEATEVPSHLIEQLEKAAPDEFIEILMILKLRAQNNENYALANSFSSYQPDTKSASQTRFPNAAYRAHRRRMEFQSPIAYTPIQSRRPVERQLFDTPVTNATDKPSCDSSTPGFSSTFT